MNEPRTEFTFHQVARRIIAVVTVVVVVNGAFGHVMDKARHRCRERESGLINTGRAKKPDVLILGSSRAKHHYDEQIFATAWNLPVYNAGFSGQGIPFSRIVFEQIAAHHPPRFVILDVMAFSDDIDRAHALDSWYWDSRIVRQLHQSGSTERDRRATLKSDILMAVPTYRFSGRTTQTLFDKPHFGERPCFEPLPGPFNAKRFPPNPNPEHYPNLPAQLRALIDEVHATGATLVLSYSPTYARTNSAEVTKVAAAIAKEKNIPFIHFDELLIPQLAEEKYFDDHMHLNGEGARIFSREAAKILKPHCGVPR